MIGLHAAQKVMPDRAHFSTPQFIALDFFNLTSEGQANRAWPSVHTGGAAG